MTLHGAFAPRFGWAGPFRDGIARVSPSAFARVDHEIVELGAFAYIDEAGEFVASGRYDQACDSSDGLACTSFTHAEAFSEGRAAVIPHGSCHRAPRARPAAVIVADLDL